MAEALFSHSAIRNLGSLRLQPVDDRVHQDEVVARISERFPDFRIKDRRLQPNAGYRAVHVIVRIGIYRVEVQVRTRAQHNWAEANEKLADLVGRGIRYGELPTDPFVVRLHEVFIRVADLIDEHEPLRLRCCVTRASMTTGQRRMRRWLLLRMS